MGCIGIFLSFIASIKNTKRFWFQTLIDNNDVSSIFTTNSRFILAESQEECYYWTILCFQIFRVILVQNNWFVEPLRLEKICPFKGSDGNVWWLNWECSIVDNFFRIHLRLIKRFFAVYLLSLSVKSPFKIMNLCGYVFSIVFFY